MNKIFFVIFILILLSPLAVAAQTPTPPAGGALPEKLFSAEVVKVLQQKNVTQPDGSSQVEQNLELKGSDGDYAGKTVEYDGIGDPESVNKNLFKAGDQVSVEASFDASGNVKYFIADYIRTGSLKWLSIIFVVFVLIVGRWKGLRSLFSLAVTFWIIMGYMLPQIMDGSDPIVVTMIGSTGILLAIIYLTEGFNAVAHLSVASIFISLLATVGLSSFFVELTKLSGLANEEASFLVGYGGQIVSFKGLLLAGIIIGALGVLDDVVIAQITSVEEINKTAGGQTRTEIFRKAMKIGVSHISAMTNTLFLAYAGASLPLLILFISGQSAFASPWQALNNEALATEVVRTLTGSIGLVLAMPIATIMAVWWVKRKS